MKLLSAWVPLSLFGLAFLLAAVGNPACALFFSLGALAVVWRFAQAMRNFAENNEEYIEKAPLIKAGADVDRPFDDDLMVRRGISDDSQSLPVFPSFLDDTDRFTMDPFFSPDHSWNPANVFHRD